MKILFVCNQNKNRTRTAELLLRKNLIPDQQDYIVLREYPKKSLSGQTS